jgi:hypothetical protein
MQARHAVIFTLRHALRELPTGSMARRQMLDELAAMIFEDAEVGTDAADSRYFREAVKGWIAQIDK